MILGAPGAGKTTMLLDLLQTLLGRARTNADKPIPMVFKLASWGRWRAEQQAVQEYAGSGGILSKLWGQPTRKPSRWKTG